MYQLGLQYISITNLTKICHFMVQFLQNHMKNHREKTLHHLFSHLIASEKKKFLRHTFLYGPKKLQEGFALFFLSYLSFKKEVSVRQSVSTAQIFMNQGLKSLQYNEEASQKVSGLCKCWNKSRQWYHILTLPNLLEIKF